MAKEVIKPPQREKGLAFYDWIPYILITATFHWTEISRKAQIASTLILGTAPLVFEDRRRPPGALPPKTPPPPFILPDEVVIQTTTLKAIRGDILLQPVAAIVNAANETLLGGGGVDKAIHGAAGDELKEHCRKLPYVEGSTSHRIHMGEAVITPSFKIQDTNSQIVAIVHTVGPRGSTSDRQTLLANAYRSSLEVAHAAGHRSIAFPAISVGIFGYPFAEAQNIVFATVKAFVEENPTAFDTIILTYLPEEKNIKSWQQGIEAAWREKILS
ncbi:MAG: macro domain-containing protein [Chlamydiia bacterium]|nr:macro domain-containing protein [Chlamydiia bacterium]